MKDKIIIKAPTTDADIKKVNTMLEALSLKSKFAKWEDIILSGKDLEELWTNLHESIRVRQEEDGKNGMQWSTIIYSDTRKFLLVNMIEDQLVGIELKHSN